MERAFEKTSMPVAKDPKNDLRSALAAVMKSTPEPKKAIEQLPPVATLHVAAVPVTTHAEALRPHHSQMSQTTLASQSKTEMPRVHHPEKNTAHTDAQETDVDRKTLQKLERILRSKGNEKPPLG